MKTTAIGMFLALLLASGPAAAGADTWAIGVAPATRKILPETPTPPETGATLSAARGEWEGFQIVIRDPEGVAGVNVTLGDLLGPGGDIISGEAARLYREHFVEVTYPSPGAVTYHERETGLYPDPLIPFFDPYATEDTIGVGAPFDLSPSETGVVFVDLYVPADAAAGSYEGAATVSAADGRTLDLPIRLHVWDFEIPAHKTVATAFGLAEVLLRWFHGGPDADPAPGYETIVANYYLALHEHRIDPTRIRGPIQFIFDADGNLEPIDWTEHDRVMGPWMDGSRFPDSVGVTRFDVGRFRPGHGTGAWTEDQYKQAARAFAEHFEEKGWWDRAYVYCVDEPWLPERGDAFGQIDRDTDLLFEASALWRGKPLVTGPFEASVAGKVGIWCPVTPMYEDWIYIWEPMPGWDTYSERFALGEELWFYVCNGNVPPSAGYDIDTKIGYEPRIVKWGTWFERASGFLYWSTNYWFGSDPWNVLLNLDVFEEGGARNGDGFLLYPGDHDGTAGERGSPEGIAIDGPIVSYRLKQIRDGLEDWEMFRLASEAGAEEYVRAQVRTAYQRFGDIFMENCEFEELYCPEDQPWTIDESVLLAARENVAAKLQYLLHPDLYEDPEAVPAPEAVADKGCGCRASGLGIAWGLVLAVAWRRRCRRSKAPID